MSQLTTSVEALDTGHITHTNEVHRLHNQLDDSLASTGDVIIKEAASWSAKTPAAAGLSTTGHTHTEANITDLDHYDSTDFATDLAAADLSGEDATAIHDNVSAEISALTEKASPADADLLIIEDSEATNVKKKVQIQNLPSGGASGGLEVDLLTSSQTLTSSGIYIIDTDTAAGNVTITLPALSGTPAAGYDIKIIREGAYYVYVEPSGTEEFWDTTTQKTIFDEYGAISCISRASGSLWYLLGTYRTVT